MAKLSDRLPKGLDLGLRLCHECVRRANTNGCRTVCLRTLSVVYSGCRFLENSGNLVYVTFFLLAPGGPQVIELQGKIEYTWGTMIMSNHYFFNSSTV